MISRFFKKKPKAVEPKKKVPEKTMRASSSEKPATYKKILTAEGWKRMMMRKTSKAKK